MCLKKKKKMYDIVSHETNVLNQVERDLKNMNNSKKCLKIRGGG